MKGGGRGSAGCEGGKARLGTTRRRCKYYNSISSCYESARMRSNNGKSRKVEEDEGEVGRGAS